MKTKLLIVSWFGMNNVGGLERVTQYMYEGWKDRYDVEIIDLWQVKKTMSIGRLVGLHKTTDALIMSLCVNKLKREYQKKILVINVLYKVLTLLLLKRTWYLCMEPCEDLKLHWRGINQSGR